MREVCGTVSAMAMIAGFLSPAEDPSDLNQRKENYALVQKFAARFKEEKDIFEFMKFVYERKPSVERRPEDAPKPKKAKSK